MLETYLELLEEAYFEVSEAFVGLKDLHVWKRPSDQLLSIGEIAGHMAFWEAIKFAGEGEDLDRCSIKSSLVDRRFRYYDTTLKQAPSEIQLSMTASQVRDELMRVHNEAIAAFRALKPDIDSPVPGLGRSYRAFLSYAPIHVSYHAGQIYTIRHLFGEQTPDN